VRPHPTVAVLAACLAVLALPRLAAAEAGTPVVVALDGSRSLTAVENAAVVAAAGDLLGRLPAGTPTGLLTFADEVRWLVRPGEVGAAEALSVVERSGSYTVLHDGLVEAIRALPEGGIVVLVSDGRDENSATTLEDVARLAGERGVRVVALAAGRAEERLLRRLALLTGGTFAGRLGAADADALAREVGALLDQMGAERRGAETRPAPAPPPAPTPAAAVEAAPARQSTGYGPLLLGLAALVGAVAAAIGFLSARRSRRARAGAEPAAEPDRGTAPGVVMPAPAGAPPLPEVDEIVVARLRNREAAYPGSLAMVSLDDTAAFQRLQIGEPFERTLVLDEEIVLTVREPGREVRSFRLPPDRAVDVGRDASRATLSFPDPTLSGRHFRLILDEGWVYLLDLGSTNGVSVQERRVESARMRPGDRFRAGMLEFAIDVRHQGLT
jgi:hypothetical protein